MFDGIVMFIVFGLKNFNHSIMGEVSENVGHINSAVVFSKTVRFLG